MTSVTLSLKPFVDKISDPDLEQLCQENPDTRLEIDPDFVIELMFPTDDCLV